MSVADVKAALGRNKFTIIRVEEGPRRHVYTLRIPTEPQALARWRMITNNFLLGTAEATQKKVSNPNALQYLWQVDFSKWFFVAGGVVKFAWRIMIMAQDSRGLDRGENMLAHCAADALREGIEVTSMPLIGRRESKGAKGSGAYTLKEGYTHLATKIGSGS